MVNRDVRAVAGGGAWSDDVAAVGTDVDLPGECGSLARACRAAPASPVHGAVPDVQAAGGGADAQGGVVFRGAALAAQSGQDCQGVEAVGQAGQIDMVADRDSRQDPFPGGRLRGVGVDVDDDQSGWTAGDSDTQLGVGTPPLCNSSLVKSGSVEAVAPTSCRKAGALRGRVGICSAAGAVRCRGLAAGSKRMHGPAAARAPACGGQSGSAWRLRSGVP